MTDEDDRLDRAERIRRMREGRGTDDEEQTTADEEQSTDDEAQTTDDPGDPERASEPDDDGSDPGSNAGEDAAEPDGDGTAADSGDGSDPIEPDHGDGQQPESDHGDGRDDSGPSGEGGQAPEHGDDDPHEEKRESTAGDDDPHEEKRESAAGDDDTDERGSGAPVEAVAGGTAGGTDDPESSATPGSSSLGASRASGGSTESGGAAAATVTEDMTAAEIAQIVDQESGGGASDDQAAFGRRDAGEEVALRAGSITGTTIVDQSFFEEGGRAQIIEFSIGDELFAIDVGYVGEIIETPEVTRIPNTPDCVQGVVDLRGKVTAVMDPSPVMASEASLHEESLIVVLDPEAIEYDGTVGWLVDDVRQVTTVSASQVTDPPDEDEWVRGIVDREDADFVIWADPTAVLQTVDASDVDGTFAEESADGDAFDGESSHEET